MHWVRDTSLSADGDRASAVETRSGRSTFLSPSSAHRQPRRRQHGWAQNARSIHDSWASRVETARISLKRMRRFRLAPRVGQNGTRPGFRVIQHGECALGALEGRFWLSGRCVRIGGRAPAQPGPAIGPPPPPPSSRAPCAASPAQRWPFWAPHRLLARRPLSTTTP